MSDFTKRVLVVEDDGMLLGVLVDKLCYLYTVDDAIDGEIAWKKMNAQHYDLILLDLMIPMVNGFELLQNIRSSEDNGLARTPILVISNLGSSENIDRAKALGVKDYFIKSMVHVDDIIKKVQSILEPHSLI